MRVRSTIYKGKDTKSNDPEAGHNEIVKSLAPTVDVL
jgi:hypothetical protein